MNDERAERDARQRKELLDRLFRAHLAHPRPPQMRATYTAFVFLAVGIIAEREDESVKRRLELLDQQFVNERTAGVALQRAVRNFAYGLSTVYAENLRVASQNPIVYLNAALTTMWGVNVDAMPRSHEQIADALGAAVATLVEATNLASLDVTRLLNLASERVDEILVERTEVERVAFEFYVPANVSEDEATSAIAEYIQAAVALATVSGLDLQMERLGEGPVLAPALATT